MSAANLVRARRALATGDLDDARQALRDVLAVALERRQPAMQSTLFHENSRRAFSAGELHDAAVLCGALRRLASRPEVTLPVLIATRTAEMETDLAAMLGADEALQATRRGEPWTSTTSSGSSPAASTSRTPDRRSYRSGVKSYFRPTPNASLYGRQTPSWLKVRLDPSGLHPRGSLGI